MHRALGSCDFCQAGEIHLDFAGAGAAGGSASTLKWLPQWSKDAGTVEIGALSVHPLGLGHDTGPTRPHVLVTVPIPEPASSVAQSAAATALSSCKPVMGAHKTLAGCGDPPQAVPLSVEAMPYGINLLSVVVCGSPVNTPQTQPMVPSHFSVWLGVTWGDVIGGFVNAQVECAMGLANAALGGGLGKAHAKLGKALGGKFPRLAAFAGTKAGKVTGKVTEFLTGNSPTLLADVGSLTGVNLNTGLDNPGRILQEAFDADGAGSEASTSVRALGFGVGGEGDGEGGAQDGVALEGPWT